MSETVYITSNPGMTAAEFYALALGRIEDDDDGLMAGPDDDRPHPDGA